MIPIPKMDRMDPALTYYNKERVQTNMYQLIGMVAVWYSCALISVATSKEILLRVDVPFSLCLIQFCFASFFSYVYIAWSGSSGSRRNATSAAQDPHIQSSLLLVALSYTLGFLFTNWAFSIVPTSFAETIKSSEAISTTIISFFVIRGHNDSWHVYLSLLPICGGVALSCVSSGDYFNYTGFFLALLSNVCFSGRAVLTKRMHLSHGDSCPDELTLFNSISSRGILLLLPVMLVCELQAFGLLVSDILLSLASSSGDGFTKGNKSFLLLLFLVNGIAFSMYNLESYIVLRHTDLVTHAVLNALRRVFIILISSAWFGTHLSALNMLGVFSAVGGVVIYGYMKGSKKKNLLL